MKMRTIIEPARKVPVVHDVDVLVAGGGPGGIAAAVAAARNGAKTLLVDSHGFLGGIATTGIPFQGFHGNNGNLVIKGIGWELMERLIASGASPGPWFFDGVARAGGAAIMYDGERFKTLATQIVRESGASILLHTSCVAPILNHNSVSGVFVESKSGRQAMQSKVLIDATGDGDIAVRAGAEFEQGNAHGLCQPVTVLFHISNVDMDEFLGDVDRRPGEYDITLENPGYREAYHKGVRPAMNGLRDLCRQARERGEYSAPNPLVAVACMPAPGTVIVNMAMVKPIDATNAADLTKAEIVGSDAVWGIIEFFRKYVPGFAHARVEKIEPYVAIRESRRCIGEHVLNEEEMVACIKFDDRIARSARGVDIHDPTPNGSQPSRSMNLGFPKGYYIPYGCLIPKHVENVLLAGRCISVNYRAFGSTRVMATCMAVGEAAGVAAALACRDGVSPREVNIDALQSRLREQGALID